MVAPGSPHLSKSPVARSCCKPTTGLRRVFIKPAYLCRSILLDATIFLASNLESWYMLYHDIT